MASKKKVPIGQFFSDGRRVDEAVKSGARRAVLLHEQRNAPLVVWRNGKVALIPPGDLKLVLRGKKKETRRP